MDDLEIESREMYKALSLLHSTEENSGKNLLLMLDSMIQEKFGFQKTVTSRISKTFLNKAENCQTGEPQNVSLETIKNFKTESFDSEDYDNVPRISIPDEGSDESVSQMRNGSNLEAFISLECQNCLEICQPLENQSIDIDNFDTELMWLCENCTQHAMQTKNLKTYSNRARVCRKITRSQVEMQNQQGKLIENT